MPWNVDELPDLSDRTFVVTGANSGIGWEAARLLARRGGRVVLACRNAEKAKAAAARIHAALPTARLELATLDLGSLRSIRACAEDLRARFPTLDALVNNAGIMAIPRSLTEDGFETQLGTNHLGHFALAGLLYPALREARAPRIVNVASGVHWYARMRFDDLMGERSYRRWMAYGQSKLANLLFTFEARRRLDAAGVPMLSVACHPGYASTNLQIVSAESLGGAGAGKIAALANGVLAQSAEAGAWPTVQAAAGADVVSGDVYGPAWFGWGPPEKCAVSAAARDADAAARLWEESERLTGVRWLS